MLAAIQGACEWQRVPKPLRIKRAAEAVGTRVVFGLADVLSSEREMFFGNRPIGFPQRSAGEGSMRPLAIITGVGPGTGSALGATLPRRRIPSREMLSCEQQTESPFSGNGTRKGNCPPPNPPPHASQCAM
jgi:hypothetical protein